MKALRTLLVVAVLLGVAVAGFSQEPALGRFADSLTGGEAGPLAVLRRHQVRSWQAMWELASRMPLAERPRAILYPASGVHMAPLVMCEALPAGSPCSLDLTELDSSVEGPISDLLEELTEKGVVTGLQQSGERSWRFKLSGHPVRLRLLLRQKVGESAPPLLTPELLSGHDMVVSHDWAGDPVGNLRVILWFLRAARELQTKDVPSLMIEDLGAHPYPVDLIPFQVLARSSRPYGHRPGKTVGTGHARIELGPSIFGGAVVLGFGDGWWRRVSEQSLPAVMDLLLVSRFGWSRRNVLRPGEPPWVSPEILDWWTGFGARIVEGPAEPLSPELVRRLARATLRAGQLASPEVRAALCGHLKDLEGTLRHLAEGKPLPAPALHEVPIQALPSVARQRLDEARLHQGDRKRELAELRRRAQAALSVLRKECGGVCEEECTAGVSEPAQKP